ncbi:MAG: 2-succinyl-6-hydroxy-2,4-cyclohexadiene-1-carboxylate synthase [candidate division Zixibacteria bacterium]|nr:2-succinyl-6-hydroxy-2,4-cyclohexadiene-1-carboxylate synthase [candidate division Zixibacteria bacterium]
MESTCQFSYVERGEPTNDAILFLHGFMGGAADWEDCGVTVALSERYRVVSVDLPGHGMTVVRGGSESYRMENCAEELICFMDKLQIDRCHLVGYSMGGRLALYMMANFPDRFDKVVLESASPGLRTPEERQERIAYDEALASRLETESLQEFLVSWYELPLFASLKNRKDLLPVLVRRRLKNDTHGLSRSLRMMGTGMQPSLWSELKGLKGSLLLIVGEKDDKFQRIGREMVDECRVASMNVVSNAGHNVHLENPVEYVQCVRNFFERL